MKKKIFGIASLLLASILTVQAESFVVDDITYSTITDNSVEITGYNGTQSIVSIPNAVNYNDNTYSVIQIGNNAFRNCEEIISISIPDNVKSLGKYAMALCKKLRKIEIGAGMTDINSLAFFEDDALDTIIINAVMPPALNETNHFVNTVKIFVPNGSGAAYRLAKAWNNNIIIEEDEDYTIVEVSTPGTFSASLNAQIAPNAIGRLKIVGEMDSNDWKALKSQVTQLWDIDMTEVTNAKIPDNQFNGKYFLCEVKLPNTLKEIGKQAFYKCDHLTGQLIFPESFELLGVSSMQSSGISSVRFQSNVRLEQMAFAYCSNLTEITSELIVGTIGAEAFLQCPLKSFSSSSNLERIGAKAFNQCSYLSDLKLNEGLTVIDEYAFWMCPSLTQVILPESLNNIEIGAFYNRNLHQVYAPWENPITCHISGFFGDPSESADCTLFVPAGSMDKYKSADGWNKFTDIKYHEDFNSIEQINDDIRNSTNGHIYNINGTISEQSYGQFLIKDGKKFIIK